MREQFGLILDSLQESWLQIISIVPRVLTAIVLLLIGWIVARAVRRGAVRLLRFLRLEDAAETTGVDDFLVRGGVRFTLVTLIGEFLYWGLLLIFVLTVFNLSGLSMGPDFVERLTGYIPSVLAAMVVLVFGTLGSRLLRGLVEAYLGNVGMKDSDRIGILVQWTFLAFVVLLALQQLQIDVAILASIFQLAFGAVCLALALAFGLGGRAWAESVLQRAWSRR
jgi:hypothetical protein